MAPSTLVQQAVEFPFDEIGGRARESASPALSTRFPSAELRQHASFLARYTKDSSLSYVRTKRPKRAEKRASTLTKRKIQDVGTDFI